MSCSYSDIAIKQFDKKALKYNPPVTGWKKFRDDIFLVRPHAAEDLTLFFNDMNNIVLEFLDLKCTFGIEHKRISIDIFAKATNSFTYVLHSTCFPKKSIENVPKGIALGLRRICDSDDKFEERSVQYQKFSNF